ncbi:MAG: hypothetical protein ACRD2Z_05800 [Thermoanaerobaculia bacterium]
MLYRLAYGLGALCVVALGACGSTSTQDDGSASGSAEERVVEPAEPGAGTAEGASPGQGGTSGAPPTGSESWKSQRFDEYGLVVRVPSSYVQLTPVGEPIPAPAHRLAFGEPRDPGSPTAGLEPPAFAVDIYDNREGLSLDAWLDGTGVREEAGRWSLSPATVAGRDGRLLAGSAQMAPNAFYYVAAGSFVYRMTPLGPEGERILAEIELSAER